MIIEFRGGSLSRKLVLPNDLIWSVVEFYILFVQAETIC